MSTFKAQAPLQQCTRSMSQFAVEPSVQGSRFEFDISGGEIVFDQKNDSIVVRWGDERGHFRFGVKEISPEGCEGEWVYTDIELIGTPYIFPKTKRRIHGNEFIQLKFSPVFTYVEWNRPDVVDNKIVRPGEYGITVTDENGCIYKDKLIVIGSDQDRPHIIDRNDKHVPK